MFIIPGQLIAIVTFPGVIVHEIAHQLFCRLLKVPVFDVCYFRTENPAGYVIHEKPKEAYKNLLIGIGPFFVNTLLGCIIAMGGAIPALSFHNASFPDILLLWLGISIAMHAIPSSGDAKSIWEGIKGKDAGFLVKVIGTPIVAAIYLASLAKFFWFDFIYAAAVALLIPNLIVKILA